MKPSLVERETILLYNQQNQWLRSTPTIPI